MNIAKLIEQVQYGTSKRFDCPLCGSKNTLTISKEGGKVFYNCFKAKCSLKGSRYVKMTNEEGKALLIARNPLLKHRIAAKTRFAIPDYWVIGLASKKCFQMLLNHNAIEAYTLGLFKIAYDPKKDRLVYLIQNINGSIVGAVGRTLSNQHPKSYNYPDSSTIPFTCGTGNTAVLVEDCASACSIGRFKEYTGVAMLGTTLTNETLFYVIANFSSVIIAVDRDATSKSVKIKRAIEYFVPNVQIWKLVQDFKNLDHTGMLNYIQSNKSPIITIH